MPQYSFVRLLIKDPPNHLCHFKQSFTDTPYKFLLKSTTSWSWCSSPFYSPLSSPCSSSLDQHRFNLYASPSWRRPCPLSYAISVYYNFSFLSNQLIVHLVLSHGLTQALRLNYRPNCELSLFFFSFNSHCNPHRSLTVLVEVAQFILPPPLAPVSVNSILFVLAMHGALFIVLCRLVWNILSELCVPCQSIF
jgi:hypothetical protein